MPRTLSIAIDAENVGATEVVRHLLGALGPQGDRVALEAELLALAASYGIPHQPTLPFAAAS